MLARAEPLAKKQIDDHSTIAKVRHDASRGWQYFNLVLAAAGVPLSNETETALAELRAYHRERNLWEHVPDGVSRALQALVDLGLRLAIVSNANGTLCAHLDRLGLSRYAHCVLDSFEHGVEKRDPRIFSIALERTGANAANDHSRRRPVPHRRRRRARGEYSGACCWTKRGSTKASTAHVFVRSTSSSRGFAPVSLALLVERDSWDRCVPRGGGHQARDERDQAKYSGDGGHHRRIHRSNSIKLAFQRLADGVGAGKPGDETGRGQATTPSRTTMPKMRRVSCRAPCECQSRAVVARLDKRARLYSPIPARKTIIARSLVSGQHCFWG